MATVEETRSRHRSAKSKSSDESPKRRSHAFRNGGIVMLLLLAVSVYFTPWVVANTPLRDWALQSALKLDGSVSLGSVSLSWFSSVVAENIEIRDAQGEVLLEVATISTEKPLLGLLLDYSDLGQIHVGQPVLHLVAREKDTNLEEVFGPLLATEHSALVGAQLTITEGKVLVNDAVAGRQFTIDKLELVCSLSDAEQAIALVASGMLPDDRQPGEFKIDLQTKASASTGDAFDNGKIDCQTSAVPLELAEPLVRRVVKDAQVSGMVSTRLAGAWGTMAENGDPSVAGDSLITGLSLSAAALGKDRIQLDRVEMPCHLVQDGELVRIEQLGVQCELGNASLSGSVKLSDLSAKDRMAALAHENYELKGSVDLAKLAALLPHTLQIRDGTEITSGQVALTLASEAREQGTTWTGRIDTSNLGAQADGRAVVWEKPLAIEFATHETKDGLVVDRAHCASTFLQLDAEGTVDDLTAAGSFDLAQLVKELRQFSDLGGIQLAGQGKAQLTWKRTGDDQFTAAAEFDARGFQFIAAQGRTWTEDNLVAKLNAAGTLKEHAVSRVNSADLTVDVGEERLQAKLQEAVTDPRNATWPILCSWRGQLAHWAPRLASLAGLEGWDLAGAGAMQGLANCSQQAIEVTQAKADFNQLRITGHDWFINEPTVSTSLAGRYDRQKGRIDVTQASLTAGNTAVTIDKALLLSKDQGWSPESGSAKIVAELANLYRWHQDPRVAPDWQVSGRLSVQADLTNQQGVIAGSIDGGVEQMQLVDLAPSRTPNGAPSVWREPRITFTARGNYQESTEKWQLDQLQLASAAVECKASGTLAMLPQGQDVDLKGSLAYDWAKLAPWWRPYLGEDVQITGQQTRSFAVKGLIAGDLPIPQSCKNLVGDAAVGWAGINLHGLRVGQGDIVAHVADGHLKAQPINVDISEGRFTLTPDIRFDVAPAHLLVQQGPLLTDIHLTPELCARGMKYVAPVLSESAVADGRFSIVMDGGWAPIADPEAGDVSGHMAMKCQVKAGPVAQEFMVLLNEIIGVLQRGQLGRINEQSGALITVDASNVEFRMVNRRVYHRGLKFTAGTTPITTYGSVGFDNSLAIIAEVPIQAKLLGIDLSLGALEGQTIQIPIEGTLSKPKLDRSILTQLPAKILQNTTRGILIDGLNKQLDRLLPGQQ